MRKLQGILLGLFLIVLTVPVYAQTASPTPTNTPTATATSELSAPQAEHSCYTGDGVQGRVISTATRLDGAIVKRKTTSGSTLGALATRKSVEDDLTFLLNPAGHTAVALNHASAGIIDLPLAGGFTVSDNAEVNTLNETYCYYAVSAGGSLMSQNKYTGNGSLTPRAISVTIQPDLLILLTDNDLLFKTTQMATTQSCSLLAGSSTACPTNKIVAMGASTFTVGAAANTNLQVYYYLTFKKGSIPNGWLVYDHYKGNNQFNRPVDTTCPNNLLPLFVGIRGNSTTSPCAGLKGTALNATTDGYLQSLDKADIALGMSDIEPLNAFGTSEFRIAVNDDTECNDSNVEHFYFAFCDGNYPSPTPTVTNTFTPLNTGTPTSTPTRTATLTRTPTRTFTNTPTRTPTHTHTRTFTPTITKTPSITRTPSSTATNTLTPTRTRTPTNTTAPTNINSPTRTPTVTRTPTATAVPGTILYKVTCASPPCATVYGDGQNRANKTANLSITAGDADVDISCKALNGAESVIETVELDASTLPGDSVLITIPCNQIGVTIQTCNGCAGITVSTQGP